MPTKFKGAGGTERSLRSLGVVGPGVAVETPPVAVAVAATDKTEETAEVRLSGTASTTVMLGLGATLLGTPRIAGELRISSTDRSSSLVLFVVCLGREDAQIT